MRWLALACRLGVGATLIYASLDKLEHPAAFAQVIYNYHLLPMAALHVMALLMPMAELVIGLALILGWQRRGASLLAALLTVVFIIAIASALSRGLDISCGCFNTNNGHAVGMSLLYRDIMLLVACLPPLFLRRCGPEIDSLFRR